AIWTHRSSRTWSRAAFVSSFSSSAHKCAELRRDSRALARRAPDVPLLVLRDSHGQFERLLALLAEVFVARHSVLLVFSELPSLPVAGMLRRRHRRRQQVRSTAGTP